MDSPEQPNLRRGRRSAATNGARHHSVIDRLPPHSQESEQALLGSILLDPQQALPCCIGKITSEAFYDLRHQTIFETMVELFEENAPIEVISVFERLNAWGKAEVVGGATYIASLPDATPSAANAEYWVGIVRDNWLKRRMIHVCTESVGRIFEHEGNTDELLDTVERDVLRVAESRAVTDTPSTLELVRQAIRNMEVYHERNGELIGIGSGYGDLDRLTQGFRPGNMIVLAARPSVGKTSLAMNIAEHVSVDNNIPVGVFSLEMTAVELTERMIASRARVNLRNLREGFLAERDLSRITNVSGQIAHAPLFIDDKSDQSILGVRAKARRWKQQHDIRLVVIDYLQLMNAIGSKRKYENRQQEITEISSGVKALAKELQIPVIVLSQLNRAMEKENRRPRLSDLRESGSIEQDADMVLFLSKASLGKKHDDDDDESGPDTVNTVLDIGKQRNGPTGPINLTFFKCFTRFESSARVSDEDIPEAAAPQQSLPYND